jgi:hypothetical protein
LAVSVQRTSRHHGLLPASVSPKSYGTAPLRAVTETDIDTFGWSASEVVAASRADEAFWIGFDIEDGPSACCVAVCFKAGEPTLDAVSGALWQSPTSAMPRFFLECPPAYAVYGVPTASDPSAVQPFAVEPGAECLLTIVAIPPIAHPASPAPSDGWGLGHAVSTNIRVVSADRFEQQGLHERLTPLDMKAGYDGRRLP